MLCTLPTAGRSLRHLRVPHSFGSASLRPTSARFALRRNQGADFRLERSEPIRICTSWTPRPVQVSTWTAPTSRVRAQKFARSLLVAFVVVVVSSSASALHLTSVRYAELSRASIWLIFMARSNSVVMPIERDLNIVAQLKFKFKKSLKRPNGCVISNDAHEYVSAAKINHLPK